MKNCLRSMTASEPEASLKNKQQGSDTSEDDDSAHPMTAGEETASRLRSEASEVGNSSAGQESDSDKSDSFKESYKTPEVTVTYGTRIEVILFCIVFLQYPTPDCAPPRVSMLATPFGRCLAAGGQDTCFDGILMSSHCHLLLATADQLLWNRILSIMSPFNRINKYFNEVHYTDWSIIGCLNWIGNTSTSANEVREHLRVIIKSRAKSSSMLVNAKRRLEQLESNFETTWMRPEVQQHLNQLDLNCVAKCYETKTMTNVIKDKIGISDLHTRNFANITRKRGEVKDKKWHDTQLRGKRKLQTVSTLSHLSRNDVIGGAKDSEESTDLSTEADVVVQDKVEISMSYAQDDQETAKLDNESQETKESESSDANDEK
ncbi:hypothetical protein BC936DRAFT_148257, partial [Jimgerdemannia flammicorona]